jgi:hypothetical protein
MPSNRFNWRWEFWNLALIIPFSASMIPIGKTETEVGNLRVGIIMCKIFEHEILHILQQDKSVENVFVVKTKETEKLEQLLKDANQPFNAGELKDIGPRRESNGTDVVIEVLELGLHIYKDKIKAAVLEKARLMQPEVDSILLLYGLCGNALYDIEDVVLKEGLRAIIPKDKDGYIIDDCIGVLLGGKRGYWNELRKECGTWFSTSGWSLYGPDILQRDLGSKSMEMTKYIIKEISHYKRVLIVETGVEDANFHGRSEEFAKAMDLRVEQRSGDLNLLIKAWTDAKDLATQGIDCVDAS